MSFNNQGNMGQSNYILNIIELQNVITSATGLTPIEQVQNEVAALQTMVNVEQKRIFTNIISRFDTTPIQITDDVNLSNANLYQNGVLFTGGTTTGGGGAVTNISSGGTSITLVSTTSGFSTAIGFNVGGRTVFSLDGLGRALYFDPNGTGNRFWVSSATLISDRLQVGGNPTPGMVLTAISSTGLSQWSYLSTITNGSNASVQISSGGIFFLTGSVSARDAGRVDSNRNWYLGNPSLTGNTDLTTSNDFTVIGGRLRYQGGGTPVAGQVLTVADALGNVVLSNVGSGTLSSFVIGNQIQSGATSARADGTGQFVAFTQGASEIARFTGSGRLGIQTTTPSATLDVNGSAVIGGSLTISPGTSASGYVFTTNDTSGLGSWQPLSNIFSGTNQWVVNSAIPAFQGILNGVEQIRLSTTGGYFGANGAYSLTVNGTVLASAFGSASRIRFLTGSTEVGTFLPNGNFGIGTSTPLYKLHVAGSQSNEGSLAVSTTLTVLSNASFGGTVLAGAFSGNGSNITNIQTINVGSGSNRLDTFQTDTRLNILNLQIGLSTLSTNIYSTLYSYNLAGGTGFFSTLSSYLTQTSNSLSAAIGPGAGAVVSTYSTSVGFALDAQFSTLSSYIVTNTSQFSTLSSMLYMTSLSDRAYASTVSYTTTSTVFSTVAATKAVYFSSLAVGYKANQDVSGTIDTNGLIYSLGLRGLSSPFTMGVGTSTTMQLVGYSYTPGIGWRMSLQGDIDISGRLFRDGQLYTIDGTPDVYWAKNGSNLWYSEGNVGIGTTTPVYPLDVAGRIRCFGVDVIPGPGPTSSTSQGQYTSPWQYQLSNIYYNLGGVGMGTGISSVLNGVMMDVSGPVRIRNGPTYMSSLAVNIPYGSTLMAGVDLFASVRARSLVVDGTGTFGGRVTARDFLSLSDQRFKKDICLISDPETILSSIRGVRFQWKDSQKSDIGLLAQEVIKVLPEAVDGDIEEGLRVSYDKLIPVLIESLKKLQQRVEDLESLVYKRI